MLRVVNGSSNSNSSSNNNSNNNDDNDDNDNVDNSYTPFGRSTPTSDARPAVVFRPRENMVGVSMVLA